MTRTTLKEVQYPLESFSYEITNIATDLRDGVRLTKILEILMKRDDLSSQLRYPANSPALRMHNLTIFLSELRATVPELSDTISVSDIEMGNREKTLDVVWALISKWELPRYVDHIPLEAEVKFLKKLVKLRDQKVPSVIVIPHPEVVNSFRSDTSMYQGRMKSCYLNGRVWCVFSLDIHYRD